MKIWFQNRRTKWKKQDNITNAEAATYKIGGEKSFEKRNSIVTKPASLCQSSQVKPSHGSDVPLHPDAPLNCERNTQERLAQIQAHHDSTASEHDRLGYTTSTQSPLNAEYEKLSGSPVLRDDGYASASASYGPPSMFDMSNRTESPARNHREFDDEHSKKTCSSDDHIPHDLSLPSNDEVESDDDISVTSPRSDDRTPLEIVPSGLVAQQELPTDATLAGPDSQSSNDNYPDSSLDAQSKEAFGKYRDYHLKLNISSSHYQHSINDSSQNYSDCTLVPPHSDNNNKQLHPYVKDVPKLHVQD